MGGGRGGGRGGGGGNSQFSLMEEEYLTHGKFIACVCMCLFSVLYMYIYTWSQIKFFVHAV